MTEPADPQGPETEDGFDYDDDEDCPRCEGRGFVMICCDDLCRNSGECFYGSVKDGCFANCFECKGTGEVLRSPDK